MPGLYVSSESRKEEARGDLKIAPITRGDVYMN
jgi:hypothetical protein